MTANVSASRWGFSFSSIILA